MVYVYYGCYTFVYSLGGELMGRKVGRSSHCMPQNCVLSSVIARSGSLVD